MSPCLEGGEGGEQSGEQDFLAEIREEDELGDSSEGESAHQNSQLSVVVGELLGTVMSKADGSGKLKPSLFGKKKIRRKKKMETGLLKEILDFKPMGVSRRHFSYH